jgi:hypothetical protein
MTEKVVVMVDLLQGAVYHKSLSNFQIQLYQERKRRGSQTESKTKGESLDAR